MLVDGGGVKEEFFAGFERCVDEEGHDRAGEADHEHAADCGWIEGFDSEFAVDEDGEDQGLDDGGNAGGPGEASFAEWPNEGEVEDEVEEDHGDGDVHRCASVAFGVERAGEDVIEGVGPDAGCETGEDGGSAGEAIGIKAGASAGKEDGDDGLADEDEAEAGGEADEEREAQAAAED